MCLVEGSGRPGKEPIFEIETDKVVTQVESGFEGTLVEQCCEEGDTVGVLEKVALIEETV